MTNNEQYSLLDRSLHKVSFGSSILQELLEDIERNLYKGSWTNTKLTRPIFVTSLPRSGTTVILEALCQLPGTASHTYRDMPFIYTPVLWSKLSRLISKKGVVRERAHGDGVQISEDSPEAFEEVLWRKFFPENYSSDGIKVWEKSCSKFERYFSDHMQKIASLRCSKNENCRYLSKNNGNIARITAIKQMFPEAYILVPVRDPIQHAISMLKQHKNFMKQHEESDFTYRYMDDIGHYEFGKLHRPIQFPGLESLISNLDLMSLDYWIAYWISAFEYLGSCKGLNFVSYESLCESPKAGFDEICSCLNIQASSALRNEIALRFRTPTPNKNENRDFDKELCRRANDIYADLMSRCILKYHR